MLPFSKNICKFTANSEFIGRPAAQSRSLPIAETETKFETFFIRNLHRRNMPELPEVEAARRCVQKVCAGLTITKVYTKETGGGPRDGLLDDIVLELKDSSVAAPDIERALQGLILLHVHRKGKQLWFEFSGGDVVAMVHFGMTGSLVVKGHDIPVYMRSSAKDFEQWPPKFTKFMVEFSDGTLLAFRDPRRLGRIKIVTTAESQRLLGKLAVDPTSNDVPSPAELKVQLQGLTAPIKAVLLDQERVFCGIGNYLADEILYQAKLHPATRASALSETHLSVLLQATQYVIKTCIDADSDYKHFPADWLFHARWSKGKSKKSKITLPNGTSDMQQQC
jgi:formamidopyrimidine-DNA glycosylase